MSDWIAIKHKNIWVSQWMVIISTIFNSDIYPPLVIWFQCNLHITNYNMIMECAPWQRGERFPCSACSEGWEPTTQQVSALLSHWLIPLGMPALSPDRHQTLHNCTSWLIAAMLPASVIPTGSNHRGFRDKCPIIIIHFNGSKNVNLTILWYE